MSALGERFGLWRQRDEPVKERYLAEIGGSWSSDEEALRVTNELHPERSAPVTEATVRTWAHDPEFADALKAARQIRADAIRHETERREEQEDPFRTPPRRGRFWDPFRRGQRPPDASPAYLQAFGQAAHAIGAAKDSEQVAPGESRFVAFEDLSPEQAAEAAAQQQPNMRPPGQAGGVWDTFAASRSADSFPWPTKDGQPLPLQRGAVSDVPGVNAKTEPGGSE